MQYAGLKVITSLSLRLKINRLRGRGKGAVGGGAEPWAKCFLYVLFVELLCMENILGALLGSGVQ